MALIAGNDVVIASNETVTAGSGLKRELYDADVASLPLPKLLVLGNTDPPFSPGHPCEQEHVAEIQKARVKMKQDAARRANAYATAIVEHFKANAKAVISTTTVCGRTPNPLVVNANIQPPTANVLLAIQ